jgi:hypothetical protein
MKRKKYKLVCLNSDECGFVDYTNLIPEEYICNICANPALLYLANTPPFHLLGEEELQEQSIKILAQAIKRIDHD